MFDYTYAEEIERENADPLLAAIADAFVAHVVTDYLASLDPETETEILCQYCGMACDNPLP